ncbi:tetratricopeptide repeat protein [Zooshikella ganghwensis]|uniref:Tetratricopeptide repeat protein n=1 Tax=Zooshikella ganghwensis TaxID=202772 RepID=A0A4P9VTK5_9GAMM|nr:tetratricopeptide repeat protein [Zooshikella ganghwensis]
MTMDCWEQLRIKPTTDVKSIKKAYAKQLKAFGNLDDISTFQNLREAYEQALLRAKHNKLDVDGFPVYKHKVGLTDVEQALYVAEMIYSDFAQRIQCTVWDQWLTSIKPLNKEAKDELSVKLLQFFLHHPFVPPKILKRLSCHFEWIANQWMFYRQYPESLVDRFFGSFKDGPGFLNYDGLEGLASVNADEYLQRRLEGRHALICNDISAAIEHLMSAYALYDTDPVLLRLLGCAFELANLLERAKDCFYAGYQLDNNLDFLLRVAAIEVKQQNWSQSLNLYILIVNADPLNNDALQGLYVSILNSNQIPTSVDVNSALVRLIEAPLDEGLLILIAENEYQRNGHHVFDVVTALLKAKVSLALGDASDALNIIGQLPTILDYRLSTWSSLLKTKAYINLNQYNDAKHCITYLQQCDELCPEVRYELLVCYLELGYYSLAMKLINEDIDDDKPTYRVLRARCHYKLASYNDAIKDYQAVLRQLELATEDWFQLGRCYYLVGDYSQALTSFRKCTQLDNESLDAKVEIAACLLGLKDFSQVESYINEHDLYRVRFSIRVLWLLTEINFGLGRTNNAIGYALQAWELFSCQKLIRRCGYWCIIHGYYEQFIDLSEVINKQSSTSRWWLWHKLITLFLQKKYAIAFDLLKEMKANCGLPPELTVSIHTFFSGLLYLWRSSPTKAIETITVREDHSEICCILLGLAEFNRRNFVAAMHHWLKAKRLLNVQSEGYEQWLLLLNHWVVLASESMNFQCASGVEESNAKESLISIYSLLDSIDWTDFVISPEDELTNSNISPQGLRTE